MTRALAIAMIAGLALAPAALAGSFCGIFVSTTGSDDIGGGLSSDDAVRTINYAIERAIDVGAPCVFVQQGVYTEIVRLEGNVQVIGGFDADWETGSYLDPEHQARIVGAVEKGLGQFVTVLALDGDSGGLTNLVIEGPDAMGSSGDSALSSYAVYIDGASVTLTDVRVEAGGEGVATGRHSAPLCAGRPGVLHGNRTYLMEDDNGQIIETHSISAGLDYPGVGPEHAWLKDIGRATYVSVTDDEALRAFHRLTRTEGIIPALETSHAIAHVLDLAPRMRTDQSMIINLSGRGDKDLNTIARLEGIEL